LTNFEDQLMENSVSDGGNVMLVQATVIFLTLKTEN